MIDGSLVRENAPVSKAGDDAPGGAASPRALLGHLHIEDAVSAVARRIRTAIGLGALTAGAKLPKESDLARQLGVTVFSLREALGLLRAEGLIETRVGKNGGSFVRQPLDGVAMAEEDLERLTAAELRDLGDWRTALTASAARLAARRGAAVADRLIACETDLRAATDAAAARRALGRFHVELAAGAQSMRLTRAELVMHEEFDWIVQTLLRHEVHRRVIADLMHTLADRVRASDTDAAWHAGEDLVAAIVVELGRQRLLMIARRHGRGEADDGAETLIARLHAVLDPTVTALQRMGAVFADSFRGGVDAADAASWQAVRPELAGLDETVHGLGFMAEVGLVAQADYLIKWWQRGLDRTFERDYSHQLDPNRDDFYDYSSKSYMTKARATELPSAAGPYIDFGGVDDYLVTVSVPVMRDAAFLGIMAADIRVASLERVLSPWLARAEGTCVVLNSAGRVLVSNTVRYDSGEVLSDSDALVLTDAGLFGWSVGHSQQSG